MGRDENVAVFKDTENLVRTNEKLKASVKTSTENQKLILEGDRLAEINLEKVSDRELLAIHEKRLRRILDVAVLEADEVVILGAFGCGAFANSPDVVALAAKNVIKDYIKAFKVIEFAVYCSLRDDRNYKTFDRVLKSYSK